MPAITRALAVLGLLLGGAVAAVASATPASACSCAAVTSQQAYDQADAVFEGRLTRRTEPVTGPVRSTGDPVALTFEVATVHKGVVRAVQDVVTASSGVSCGLELQGEGPFLVSASAAEGGLTADLCNGTATVVADPAWPSGAPLTGSGSADLPGPSRPTLALLAAGATTVVAAAATALTVRRRRTRPAAG